MDLNLELLNAIDSFVWGPPLLVLLVGTGILLTLRLKFLQIFRLPKALGLIFKAQNKGNGDIDSFKALCTALSATVGTGNIVGVATAIAAGGPGAIFWMWMAAFFGMATKYAEGLLARCSTSRMAWVPSSNGWDRSLPSLAYWSLTSVSVPSLR